MSRDNYQRAAERAGWRHIDGDMYGRGEERASSMSWERLCETNEIEVELAQPLDESGQSAGFEVL